MGRIYFAHPVNAYNVPVEQAALALIAHTFPNDVVENPNKPVHSDGYAAEAQRTAKNRDTHKGMDYFYNEVILGGGDPEKACTSVVAMSFLDGRIGLGVAGEVKCCIEHDLICWGMLPKPGLTTEQVVERLPEFIENPLNGLFAIRQFTEKERRQLLATEQKPLVIDHQDTRLRTWHVYSKVRRPYEEAHLVETSTPPDFYPPK